MKTTRAFVAGMLAGAAMLYLLMWHVGAVAAPDLAPTRPRLAAPAPSQPGGPRAASPGGPPSPPAPRPPGDSTDEWLPQPPFARAPGLLASPVPAPNDLERLEDRSLVFPVEGFDRRKLRDNFAEMRGQRVHEALDMLAPRGTPVLAVDDGAIKKLFNSANGGLTIYQFDRNETFCYYYAHLDAYAEGLYENKPVRRGERLGYVGTSGNAPKNVPHLHFTIFKLGPDKRWWEGMAINPFPLWALR